MSADRFAEALSLHRRGALEEAGRLYGLILGGEPRHAGALHMLGVLRLGQERFDEAVGLLRRSIEAEPRFATAHYNLGCALQALGRPEEAEVAYGRALAVDGRHAASLANRSGVRLQLGRPLEAFEDARRAAELVPSAASFCNAGLALKASGNAARAETMFHQALGLEPDHAESLHNLGNLLRVQRGRDEEARAILGALVRTRPRMIAPRIALSHMLREACEGEAAAAELQAARDIAPEDPLVRLALTTAPLQALYRSEEECEAARDGYGMQLAALDRWARAGGRDRLASLAGAAGYSQPFFLPYTGQIDRDLQATYGALMADAATARYGASDPMPRLSAGEKIRVGFVSGYMRDHSNWKIPLRGWMEGLDRDQFDVLGYYTGEITQAETGAARGLCSVFRQGPKTTQEWRACILADRPDVLIYPETGMDGAAFRLACQRLAPLQCVSWGHPFTSGLPTIDAFLSSDAMEPQDAEAHYTERLVRLPGLGIDYRAEPVPPALSRGELGLPDGTLFFCGQALFKYLPRHDRLLAEVAASVPDARFVFVDAPQGRKVRALLLARLARSLDVERRVILLDRMSRERFVAASGACDVVLDSLEWSGCNSTLECLPLGTPIVTLPGRTMRARHTTAILRAIGVAQTIARDEEDYVRLATDLARDREWRSALRTRIVADWQLVCGDRRPIRALEEFIGTAMAGHRGKDR